MEEDGIRRPVTEGLGVAQGFSPAFVTAALVLAAANVGAQSTRPPQFTARTELVQVDVVALDEQGRPVRGLTASDFTLLDRKTPRPISTFTEISHQATADSPGADPLPPNTARNTGTSVERAVVLVIHDNGLWQERVDATKQMARRVIDGLGTRASIAVLFTSGRGGVEFSANPAEATAAVERLRGQRFAMRRREGLFRTIEEAAKYLRTNDSRRKAVILISEGMADLSGLFDIMRPRPGPSPIYDKKYVDWTGIEALRMMNELRRSNVTLYGVDPRGRLQTTAERSREGRSENPVFRMDDENFVSQEGLKLATEASGGFAIVDTNAIEAGLDRIVNDLDSYYLLGFYGDEKGDDWRNITVTVNRPGVTVRHRRGYWPGQKVPKPRNTEPLMLAVEGVLPSAAVPVTLTADIVLGTGRVRQVVARLQSAETGAGEATVVAVDLDRKKAVRRWTRKFDDVKNVEMALELPPGRYQLRAAVRSDMTGQTGSVYLLLTVK